MRLPASPSCNTMYSLALSNTELSSSHSHPICRGRYTVRRQLKWIQASQLSLADPNYFHIKSKLHRCMLPWRQQACLLFLWQFIRIRKVKILTVVVSRNNSCSGLSLSCFENIQEKKHEKISISQNVHDKCYLLVWRHFSKEVILS